MQMQGKVSPSYQFMEVLKIKEGKKTAPPTQLMPPSSEAPVSGSMAIVLLLSRWFGAAPVYTKKRDGRWFVRYSPRNSLYGQLLVGFLVTSNITCLIIEFTLDSRLKVRTKYSMDSLVWSLDVLFVSLIMGLGVYLGPRRVRQMIQAVNCMEKINFDIKSNLKKPKKKQIILTVYYLISLILLLVCDFARAHFIAVSEDREWRISCVYSGFYIMYFCTFLIEVHFVLLAIAVKTSLKSINNILVEVLFSTDLKNKLAASNGDGSPVATINRLVDSFTVINNYTNTDKPNIPECVFVTISKMKRHHGSLCDVIDNLNQANGPILCVLVASFILHLVMSPYYLISNLAADTNATKRGLLLHCAWCIFHSLSMFALIEPCHRTSEEIRCTKQLLSQLMRGSTSSSSPLYKQLDMFYRQLMMSCTEYQPLGVCTLNRPLVATIMGGVTTYLVVLIQFDKLSN